MTESPATVVEAINLLHRKGYSIDYDVVDGELRANGAPSCALDRVVVEQVFRFEGASDPGDEMVVFAVRDPDNGGLGTLVSAYGPLADPALVDFVVDRVNKGPTSC
ncbi:MAG: hypothetical protein KAZ88_10445 [Acidimicrobiia bacterium]|jgi:hypothetical protein|nr:hypothetical protein [Acidimicrobiia bacterium]MBP8181398.1 hypothetical protein [Acidimicrobiia bacterium]